MTTYRLPDALGGAEVEILSNSPETQRTDFVRVSVETDTERFIFDIPQWALVEVEPPLPPEPDKPAYFVDRDEKVWQKVRSGWQCITGGRLPWADLWRDYGPLTRLMLDPFAEPVELPWAVYGIRVGQCVFGGSPANRVFVSSGYTHLKPTQAREMAKALWAAADAADAPDAVEAPS